MTASEERQPTEERQRGRARGWLADAGYKTLWIAHWGVTSPTIPANNWGGHGWTFWQFPLPGGGFAPIDVLRQQLRSGLS